MRKTATDPTHGGEPDRVAARRNDGSRPLEVWIVASRDGFETAWRELTAGSTVTLTASWRPGGGAPAATPPPPVRYLRRLPVPSATGDEVLYVRVEEIAWVEAESQYVRLHTGDRSYLVRGSDLTLTALASRLDPARFLRVHRSHIVNLERIEGLRTDPLSRRYAVLAGARQVPVSAPHWELLREALAGDGGRG